MALLNHMDQLTQHDSKQAPPFDWTAPAEARLNERGPPCTYTHGMPLQVGPLS